MWIAMQVPAGGAGGLVEDPNRPAELPQEFVPEWVLLGVGPMNWGRRVQDAVERGLHGGLEFLLGSSPSSGHSLLGFSRVAPHVDIFVQGCRRPCEFFGESWNECGLRVSRHFGRAPKKSRALSDV